MEVVDGEDGGGQIQKMEGGGGTATQELQAAQLPSATEAEAKADAVVEGAATPRQGRARKPTKAVDAESASMTSEAVAVAEPKPAAKARKSSKKVAAATPSDEMTGGVGDSMVDSDAALAASIAAAESKGKKRPSAKPAVYTDESASKRPKKQTSAKAIKDLEKKVTELEKEEKENVQKANAAKKNLDRVKSRKRFPVKDEDLEGDCTRVPLPKGHDLFPQNTVRCDESDMVMLWEFLNFYAKQLELNEIPQIEDFHDMLNFERKPTVMVTEVFGALLRKILSDRRIAFRIGRLLPPKSSFARKLTTADLAPAPPSSSKSVSGSSSSGSGGLAHSNHLSLLPLLRPEAIDALRFQSVLQTVLLKLPLVTRMQTAQDDLDVILSEPPEPKLEVPEGHALGNRRKEKETKKKHQETLGDNEKLQEFILGQVDKGARTKNGAFRTNFDALLGICCVGGPANDKFLSNLREADLLLCTRELHSLPASLKLDVLKALALTCLETESFRDHIMNNKDEMSKRMAEKRRLTAEKHEASRLGKKALIEKARELCREDNKRKLAEKAAADAVKAEKALKKAEKEKAALAAAAAAAGGGGGAVVAEAGSVSGKGGGKGKGKGKTDAKTVSPEIASPSEGGAKKGKAANKKGKDELAPSQSQLSDKLDLLLLMERLEIDVVAETVDMEAVIGAETESEDEDTNQRKANARKEQRRKDLKYKQDIADLALSDLVDALESGGAEKSLKAAIKQAKNCHLLTWEAGGKRYCVKALVEAHKALGELEEKAAEEKLMAEHERSLREFSIRSEPLGLDRDNAEYYQFTSDDRLYVCRRTQESNASNAAGSRLDDSIVEKILLAYDESDKRLRTLFDDRPSKFGFRWQVYTKREMWGLCDALDERGERERALKKALTARFELVEPINWLTAGSAFIGRTVRRKFKGGRIGIGRIIGWVPEEGDDFALWHVKHDDGDSEDLEEHEVTESVLNDADAAKERAAKAAAASAKEAVEGGGKAVVGGGSGKGRGKRSADSLSSLPGVGAGGNDETSEAKSRQRGRPRRDEAVEAGSADGNVADAEGDDDEEDATDPPFTEWENTQPRGPGSLRYRHIAAKSSDLGLAGLRKAVLYHHGLLVEGLKSSPTLNNKYSREHRKTVESSVKDSATVGAMRTALDLLEEALHSLQADDAHDVIDEDIVTAEMDRKRKDDEKKGWRFDTKISTYVGKWARRFHPNNSHLPNKGVFDGRIVAFWSKNGQGSATDGDGIWRFVDTDGDEEELDETEVLAATLAYSDNKSATEFEREQPEAEAEGDDANADDVEYDSDIESISSKDMESGVDCYRDCHPIGCSDDKDGTSSLLWPTAGVRRRWKDALSASSTVSELALAHSALIAQAKVGHLDRFSSFVCGLFSPPLVFTRLQILSGLWCFGSR